MLWPLALQIFLVVAARGFQPDPISTKPIEDNIGTLLITEDPIAFTSLVWRLVFEWDLEPLAEALQQLKYVNDNLTRLEVDELEEQALLHVTEALDTAAKDYNNFMGLVQGTGQPTTKWFNATKRGKRQVPEPETIAWEAWKGSSGSLLSSVLGMASSEEMENVHALLDTLFRREAKMVTVQKLHLTAVQNLQSQITGQQDQLDRIVNITVGLYQTFSDKLGNRTDATLGTLLLHNNFINAVGLFRTTVMSHRQILISLDRGYMDSELIPAEDLRNALNKIKESMPKGFRMVFDPQHDNLTPYYNLKLAHRITGSGNIRGMLQVPLTGTSEEFILYKSVPFPSAFSPGSHRRFILQDSVRYVAISKDKKQLLDLGSVFNPSDCMQGPTIVCPATAPTISDPASNCIFHLISGNLKLGSTSTKCTMAEIATEDVYVQGIDTEEWAMSSPKPVLVEATCIDLNNSGTPMTKFPGTKKTGDLILHIPRSCSVSIDHQVIPMRLLMSTKMGRLPSRLNLPPLHTHQLLSLHGAKILEDKMDQELNKAIKELLESRHDLTLTANSSQKEVQRVMFTMQRELNKIGLIQPEIHYHYISWGSAIFCIFLFIGGICMVYWVKARVRVVSRAYAFKSDGTVHAVP